MKTEKIKEFYLSLLNYSTFNGGLLNVEQRCWIHLELNSLSKYHECSIQVRGDMFDIAASMLDEKYQRVPMKYNESRELQYLTEDGNWRLLEVRLKKLEKEKINQKQ
ncbi:MAG: hypothetical protein C4K58_06820 [Flavobacteriaceae bacterium]|nr:MAG: hypothetical protein C4K58_06820 [Flavobacteriaceae bacterium]